MSRYNYRIKRKLFRDRGIDRFKNFDALERQYASRRRTQKIIRYVILLIALVLLIGAVIFSVSAQEIKKSTLPQPDPREVKFRNAGQKL